MLDKMKQLMEMKRQADQIKRELESVTVDVQEVRGSRSPLTVPSILSRLRSMRLF